MADHEILKQAVPKRTLQNPTASLWEKIEKRHRRHGFIDPKGQKKIQARGERMQNRTKIFRQLSSSAPGWNKDRGGISGVVTDPTGGSCAGCASRQKM